MATQARWVFIYQKSIMGLYSTSTANYCHRHPRSHSAKQGEKAMKLNLLLLVQWCTAAFLLLCHCSYSIQTPTPTPWPEQFHALLYMNLSAGNLQMSDLWYDWPRGLNANIIQKQLGEVLYDVEWDNGTSYYYTLGEGGGCRVMYFEVGIVRPDFLDGAEYLGTQVTDGFLCHVWEKVDFIWYYEDVLTRRPVRWDFYDGACASSFMVLVQLINKFWCV